MKQKKVRKDRKTKTITFQPTPQTAAQIALIKKNLGLGKSQIVRICVEQHLPFLLRKHISITQSIMEELPRPLVDSHAPSSLAAIVEDQSQGDSDEPRAGSSRHERERKK